MTKQFTIIDEAGLHARPACILSQTAAQYPNDIYIEYKGLKMTLKSILVVMSMAVPKGGVIKITVEGEQDELILDSLATVLSSHNLIASK